MESPEVIRDRAVSVADYLLAVRASMERPARVVPGDTIWTDGLPGLVETGPAEGTSSWLRVGLPAAPGPVEVPAELRDSFERNDADDVLLERWKDEHWRPWREATAAVERARVLHRRLFDLMHLLDMSAATTELVWGHGVLETVIGDQKVRYPLVATPVMIEYEPDRSLISVSPAGPSRLQTDALTGTDDRYLAQLLAVAGPGGIVDTDLWNDLDRRELFERAMGRLGYDKRVDGPEGTTRIADTGVIFARPKQRQLRGFLENLRERLRHGGSPGSLAAIVAHEPSKLVLPDDRPEDWTRVGERLLMPLPTNEAQESIARRLAQHRNVAVQGPPGTGKTHTIRNLICHLMANGKRVLVVAQKEDPLRVLRDGLPEGIRALCLAVLGRTTDQLVQLQLAARELSDRAATLDKRAEAARVERLNERLEAAEADLAQTIGRLRAIAESEAATYPIDGAQLSPAEVGAWLRQRAPADGGIPDPVVADPPLNADDFGTLLELADRLDARDRTAAMRPLPDPAELPPAERARDERARRDEAWERVQDLEDQGLDPDVVREHGRDAYADLGNDLHEAVQWLRRREGEWTGRLGRLLDDPHWQRLWSDHVAATSALLAELAELSRGLAGHRVTAQVAAPKQLLSQLAELRQRFATGRGVSRLMQPALHKLANETVRVDDEPLRTADDVDVAINHVRRSQTRRRLADHWSEWIERLGIPQPGTDAEAWAGPLVADAAQSLDWDTKHWPDLSARLRLLVPQQELDRDAERLAAVESLLTAGTAVFDLDELDQRQAATAAMVEKWPELTRRWRTLDGWDEAVAETRRLRGLRPAVEQYILLRNRLAGAAPEWADMIEAGEVPAVSGDACLRAWAWRRAQTWFDEVAGSVDPAVLGRRVEVARERIRGLTGELVVASAWLEVSRALDDRRRAALADWTTALRKIGKGTGRTAAAWQAHAQRAMESAVEAVPVWVMSVDRAIEQFAGGAHFDVVIVDEASQADLFALPVLALAERAVVVGDDQQIGPQLGFVGSVTGLIHSHLRHVANSPRGDAESHENLRQGVKDVPSAEHFDPESSLYDHAVRRSPERILLTEHFRCVPQIIEFSSRHYYDGKIMPLRADRPSLAPLKKILVEGQRQTLAPYGEVNLAEAEALVGQVAAIVADPAYRGKTLGVISLLSTSGQAALLLERLREAIGEDEMEARRLRVGDAYTFQGDERDVVLVSMVVSAKDGRVAAFTRREYHRRINVAASRARDQLWIYHSVQASQLVADDARALLLNYEPSGSALETAPENDFERDVYRRLTERGYRPTPQFRIGAYRIDFVLNAPDGRRLAIECDGDSYQGPEQWESDMRRQAVLERVGNCVFVRIRGSIFAREPDAAMRPVWQRMADLDISPFADPDVSPAGDPDVSPDPGPAAP
ncbi:AAA domain-containing protein [Actinoplanes sp. NPDC049265]|uniref:AAA domain-containing protein n=1 Tax=Actinoplanes sp. NPDC049265 TaxID=3363902 RepID=UPI00371DE8C1